MTSWGGIGRDANPKRTTARLTVRNLEDSVKQRLQARARRHGNGLEEEVRSILRHAVRDDAPAKAGLGSRISAMFAGDGLDEPLPELRDGPALPAEFEP